MKKITAAVAILAVSTLFLGAGCSRNTSNPNPEGLKAPAPAAAPKQAPEIPPEAKNIPRPY